MKKRLAAIGQPASRTVVPFQDLRKQDNGLRDEIILAIQEIAESAHFSSGPFVKNFEEAFADEIGVKHCVGVNSGTSALHLALICAGVAAGDEVITVPMTFVATSWAIRYVNAKPVFVDIDPTTYTMDVTQVEEKITSKTKAIVPVHLYGQPVDIAPLKEIADRHGLALIEDAAQAHGATYGNQTVGSFGQSGCFSFYPGKNLGAYGEAGAVVTNDDAIADRLRALRNHAQGKRYHHSELGFNYRMDAIQGAVLAIKLQRLGLWTDQRRKMAMNYERLLQHLPLNLPTEVAGSKHVWHLYVVQHSEREEICAFLEEQGIQTGMHYPIPLHLQKAFADLGHTEGDFPVSEAVARTCFSLPLYPAMTNSQQARVVKALNEYFTQLIFI